MKVVCAKLLQFFLVNPFFPFNKYLVGRPSNFSFTSFSIYWRLSPEPITMIVKWFSNSTIHFTFTGWHYTESPSFLGIHGFLFYLMVYNLLLTFIFVSHYIMCLLTYVKILFLSVVLKNLTISPFSIIFFLFLSSFTSSISSCFLYPRITLLLGSKTF